MQHTTIYCTVKYITALLQLLGEYNIRSRSISDALYGNEYVVPDYQREYSWEEDRVETLWEDLLYAAQPNRKNRKYLLGPLVDLDRNSKLEIVDGQQRLVTLSLLFRAMRDALEFLIPNGSAERKESVKTELDEVRGHVRLIHRTDDNTFKNIKKHLVIEKTFKTQQTLKRQLRAKGMTKTQQNLIVNYNRLFSLALTLYKEYKLDEPDKRRNGLKEILTLIKNIKRNAMFVLITITLRDDVYTIFQSLNSKNTPLAQADLIKSYLMAESSKQDRPSISIQWKSMLSHISKPDKVLYESMLSRDSHEIPQTRLYETIRRKYKKDKTGTYLEELGKDLEIINKLDKPNNISDPKLKYALFCLSKINARYFRRVAITAMRKWGHNNKKTVELIEFLVKFFFMYRTICRKDISALRTSSRQATTKIESGCDLPQVFSIMLMDDEQQELIDQNEFMEKFKTASSNFDSKIATYILVALERHYESSDIQYPTDKLQLEHIFPQKPEKIDWPNISANKKHMRRLGNLTLVTDEWNSALSNSSFEKKMLGDGGRNSVCYNNSRLELNRRLRKFKKCEKWSFDEMLKRETKIFEEDVPVVWNMEYYSTQAKKFEAANKSMLET